MPPGTGIGSTDAVLVFASHWDNGSMDFVAYIYTSPRPFEVGWSSGTPYTIQVQSDHTFSPKHIIEIESARLARERV